MGAENSKGKTEQDAIEPVSIGIEYFDKIWYEIGRYAGPFKFEEGCVGATACYSNLRDPENPKETVEVLKPGLMFDVLNRCVEKGSYSKTKKPTKGTGEILGDGKILVSFPVIPKFVIDGLRKKGQANYMVIEYQPGLYSVVTSPQYDYLWILSTIKDFSSTDKFEELKNKYTSDVRFNKQKPGLKGKKFLIFSEQDYKDVQ